MEESFERLIERVRAGDQDAAEELVKRYEPEIRRVVQSALETNPKLRQAIGSQDICQSVFARFFLHAEAGEFDLDSPGGLAGLLVTMARNRLNDHIRRLKAGARDIGREVPIRGSDSTGGPQISAKGPTPSRIVGGQELLQKAMAVFTTEERYLVEQRNLGRSWKDLGKELGEPPDAVRMRISRAIDRVAEELGI